MRSSAHHATSFGARGGGGGFRRPPFALRPSGSMRPASQVSASASVASSSSSASASSSSSSLLIPGGRRNGNDNAPAGTGSPRWFSTSKSSSSTSPDLASTGTARQPRWRTQRTQRPSTSEQREPEPELELERRRTGSPRSSRNSNSNDTFKADMIWPVLRKLLHRPTFPVGSFTALQWQEARTILTFHTTTSARTNPEAAVALNNHLWMLLQRLVEEQAHAASQTEFSAGAWLLQPSAPFLHKLVKGWRNLHPLQRRQSLGNDPNATDNQVLSPAALLQGLEKLCLQLPGFSYDIKTFNMILDVAVVHQSQSGQELMTADNFLQYIRTAAETKPALQPNVVTWNQYLSYHVKYSKGGSDASAGAGGHSNSNRCRHHSPSTVTVNKIEDLLRQMESEDVAPDVISFTQLLNAWAVSGAPEAPFKMEELILERIQPSCSLSKKNKIKPDVFCWTLVIKAWARSGLPGAANKIASLLQRMQAEGCTPNLVTYGYVLSFWAASGLSEAPTRAEEVLQRMRQEDCTPNVMTYTHVLKIWSDSGLFDAPVKMHEILERMKAAGCKPDVVTWTQIIKAWSASGVPEAPAKMKECLQRMQEEGCQPSVVTWNQVLSYWASSKSPEAPDRVEEILAEMLPVQPSVVSYTIAIQACLRAEDPDRADALVDRMTAAGTSPTTRTFNELLAAWSKVGGIVAAEETEHIFRLMRDRSQGDPAVAPDIWSVSMLLAAWTRSGNSDALEHVQDIYDQLETGDFAGVQPDYVTCFSVVAFMAKSQRRDTLERADQILRRFLDEHDGIVGKGQYDVYGLLIRAWVEKGQVDKADSLLLHWEKCYSDGKYVPLPAIYEFRVLLLSLVDAGDLERADAIFRQWEKLFSSGQLKEGPNGPTLTKLCDGWRQSNHSEKERFLSKLEDAHF